MRLRLLVLTAVFSSLGLPAYLLLAGGLDEAGLQKLRAELQPSHDELWRTIPWKINLLDAQRTAAEERKPIFIWAMDGHPLGCT